MAVALGAIREFLHLFTDHRPFHKDSTDHIVTILDVLEPRRPRG